MREMPCTQTTSQPAPVKTISTGRATAEHIPLHNNYHNAAMGAGPAVRATEEHIPLHNNYHNAAKGAGPAVRATAEHQRNLGTFIIGCSHSVHLK